MFPPTDPTLDPLGLPPAPQAPAVPQPVQPKGMNPIAQAVMLAVGALAGPGKGTGIMQGLNLANQQAQQRAQLENARLAQDYTRQHQAYQDEQRTYQQQYQQRGAMLKNVLDSFQTELANTTSDPEAENLYQTAAQVLAAQGFRGFDADSLKRKYHTPSAQERAGKAVDKFLAGKAAAQTLENDPESLNGMMVDLGNGVMVPFAQAQEAAGRAALKGKPKPAPTGSPTPHEGVIDGKPVFWTLGPDGQTQIVQGVSPPPPRSQSAPSPGPGGSPDLESIADAIVAGKQPPTTQGMYSKTAGLRAALAKRGYDLAAAQTDWNATQAHIRTMNGPQQLRLNQAVNALPEMLDSVEDLARQWKAGRFKPLNKLTLKAAINGGLGREAASIATRLDQQIADVVADLGNVYMGGNSPTDHAIALASRSLQADWDEKTLLDNISQTRKNVQIRRNSINSTGVQGASATNPYTPDTGPYDPLGIL